MVEKRGDSQIAALAGSPALMLDGAVLIADASIKDFQQGRYGYVADAVEYALFLPGDMADLRSMRHEMFLSLKRDLALVSPPTTTPFILLLLIYIYIYIFVLILDFSNLGIYLFYLLFFFKAIQAAHRVEEIVISSYK